VKIHFHIIRTMELYGFHILTPRLGNLKNFASLHLLDYSRSTSLIEALRLILTPRLGNLKNFASLHLLDYSRSTSLIILFPALFANFN